jgi:DNA-binding NtrC family response regulator
LLDEIGDLPIDAQTRLLRVLQELTIRHLGTVESVPVDIRFVAATHQNLESAMEKGLFREDLYHRLNVLRIKVPALRERRQDIPELVDHFSRELSDDDSHLKLPESAVEKLMNYSWPGNVRELRNCLEISIALEVEPTIPCFPASGFTGESLPLGSPSGYTADRIIPLAEVERRAIIHALTVTNGDCALAAALLRVGRSTVYRKLNEYKHRTATVQTG